MSRERLRTLRETLGFRGKGSGFHGRGIGFCGSHPAFRGKGQDVAGITQDFTGAMQDFAEGIWDFAGEVQDFAGTTWEFRGIVFHVQSMAKNSSVEVFSFARARLPVQFPAMSREYVLKPYQPEVNLQIDYARELNPQQLAAVTAPPGPALVIAGAGSGKTRTLTYRVAYLLEQGIPAERILLLTFTNKAAGEMMRRVSDLLGHELRSLWGGTFHSIGARILRLHADTLGYQRDFTILDRDDAKDLIKACLVDANIDTKDKPFPKADVLNEIFSLAANTHKTIEDLVEGKFSYFSQFAAEIADQQKRYHAQIGRAHV